MSFCANGSPMTFTGKNNGFPFLDILGYLKNTHKKPKFGRVRQVPFWELSWEFPGWDLSHFAKFGIFNTLKYPKMGIRYFFLCLTSGVEAFYRTEEATQYAKKVMSDSPRLVDFVVGLVNFVLNLPDRQVKFFEEFKLRKNSEINSAHQNVFEAS